MSDPTAYRLLLIFGLLLVGCDQPDYWPDQAMRRRMFAECLARIPKGPEVTRYNDWDEVVQECGHQAYYLSMYDVKHEPPPSSLKVEGQR